MDMLRLLLPSILSVVFGVFLIWVTAHFVRSNIPAELKPWVSKGSWILTSFTLIFFAFYVIRVASVNEVPRAVIDRTLNTQMQSKFEERMKADTASKTK